MNDYWTHVVIAFVAWSVGGVFTAGGFYIYVRMSITHLERQANEIQDRLNSKIDKNFDTQDNKTEAYHKELLADLSGIGNKVTRAERDALRRHHNVTEAVLIAAPETKQPQIVGLLREDG